MGLIRKISKLFYLIDEWGKNLTTAVAKKCVVKSQETLSFLDCLGLQSLDRLDRLSIAADYMPVFLDC